MREADRAAGFYRSLRESYVKNRQAPWKGGVRGSFLPGGVGCTSCKADGTGGTVLAVAHEAKTAWEVTLKYQIWGKSNYGKAWPGLGTGSAGEQGRIRQCAAR